MKIAKLVFLISILSISTGFKIDFLTGEKIMSSFDSRHYFESKVENMVMVTLDRAGKVTERKAIRLTKNKPDKSHFSLLRFTEPADIRGTTLLSLQRPGQEDVQFLYLPGLGETRRISGKGKMGTFMGTDFSYEDLLKEDVLSFDYERILEDDIDGIKCYNIMAYPKEEEDEEMTNYAKRVLWVAQKDFRIIKIELYDHDDELIKSLRFSEFDTLPNQMAMIPRRAKMTHHRKKTESLIGTTKVKYNVNLNEKYFTEAGIKNWSATEDAEISAHLN